MRRVVLLLPLLLGNMPPPCPEPGTGDRIVDATVISVEQATYRCVVAPDPAPSGQHCISTGPDALACDLVLHSADGTTRTVHSPAHSGAYWCDLPPGQQTIQLCAPNGLVSCALDLGADSLNAHVESSLPSRERIHLRLADGTELARDSDFEFKGGEHLHYIVREHPSSLLDRCDLIEPPVARPPASHGCGHCAVGPSQPPSYVLVAAVLLILRRRRR